MRAVRGEVASKKRLAAAHRAFVYDTFGASIGGCDVQKGIPGFNMTTKDIEKEIYFAEANPFQVVYSEGHVKNKGGLETNYLQK